MNETVYYSQVSGTYTGTTVAPTYANLTLAYLEFILEGKLKDIYSEDQCNYIIKNWKRYLDDGFLPWKKSYGDIKVFIDVFLYSLMAITSYDIIAVVYILDSRVIYYLTIY